MASPPRKSSLKSSASTEAFAAVAAAEPIDARVDLIPEELVDPAAEPSASPVDDMQERVRKVAEESLEHSRSAYDRLRAAAEEATGSFEVSYTAAAKGLNEFNVKAIDALKSNTDATFDLLKALMNVKTLSEAITLQTEHARKQFEALTAQSKELAEIAKKIANETTEPLKTSVAKTFGKAA